MVNPYQPSEIDPPPAEKLASGAAARRSLQIGLVILFVPALANFVCYNQLIVWRQVPQPLAGLYLFINSVEFVSALAGAWLLGPPLFEAIVGRLCTALGDHSRLSQSKSACYATTSLAPVLAAVVALAWIAWMVDYYY
jgi:hypothetical protein